MIKMCLETWLAALFHKKRDASSDNKHSDHSCGTTPAVFVESFATNSAKNSTTCRDVFYSAAGRSAKVIFINQESKNILGAHLKKVKA